MRRGEIWWATLPGRAGRRPVVLVTRDEAYPLRGLVTVIPVTTRVRGIAPEVPLGREDGLPRESVANADVLQTIPRRVLESRLTTLGPSRMRQVDGALRYALGLGAQPSGSHGTP